MGDFTTVAMMALNTVKSSQQAKAQQNAAMAQQRADIQQRQYQLQIQEREKRDRLKQALATQRSRFGAQGLSPSSGSAAALLEGLQKDTEKGIADQRGLENLRISQLADKSARKRRINLLEFQKGQVGQVGNGLGTAFNLLER